MKKDFHGFRVEKIELPNVNVITASGIGSCNFTNDYTGAPYGTPARQGCDYDVDHSISSIRIKPYYFDSVS